MFFRLILSLQRCALVAVAFAGVELLAEPTTNQVQRTEASRDIQAIERNSPKLFRPYLPFNPFSDTSKFAPPPSSLPTTPSQNTPPSTRRNDELIDRQKNWIFAAPEKPDEQSESVEGLFGVGGMSNDKKSKGVIYEFLTRGRENVPAIKDDKDAGLFNLPPVYGLGNERENNANPLSRVDILDRYREQNLSEFSAEQNKLSQRWREQATTARAREDRQSNLQEFESLFRPSTAAALNGNGNRLFGIDQNILGSPAAAASRSGVPDRFDPRAPNSSSDAFRSAPRGVASAGLTERPDINSRVFGSSVNPPPKVEERKPERQPANLTIPRRKD